MGLLDRKEDESVVKPMVDLALILAIAKIVIPILIEIGKVVIPIIIEKIKERKDPETGAVNFK